MEKSAATDAAGRMASATLKRESHPLPQGSTSFFTARCLTELLFTLSLQHQFISCNILQKRFVVMKEKKNFDYGLAHCKSLGGTLGLPESIEENQQILNEIGNV